MQRGPSSSLVFHNQVPKPNKHTSPGRGSLHAHSEWSSAIVRTFKGKPLGEHSKRSEKPRRLDRRWERHPVNVIKVVPENCRVLHTLSTWLPAIRSQIRDERLRVDWAVNLYGVAAALIHHIDVASRTTMPGWDFLMDRAKVSRSTLKKALAWLRAHGFLATVASGRKGIYAQKGSDGHELYPSKTGERTNERAVYVLCEPLSPEALASEEQLAADVAALVESTGKQFDVDTTRPPIPTSVGTNPPHARESQCEKPKAENDGASHRLKTFYGALSERVQASCGDRRQPLWNPKATTNAGTKRGTRANELVAALTLRNDNFALRPLSGRHLAYLFRPFFEADWLIGDIKHALDTKPDGTKHRHDGLDGARNVADLIAYRLSFWMENGVVTYSYSQRYMKRSRPALERARAYTRMMEQRQKEVTKPKVSGLSAVAQEALKQIRSLFR